MRFIVRTGTDPTARADAALLRALGLPGGGVVRLGATHCRVSPGEVPSPTAILVGPRTLENAGLAVGTSVDVTRSPLPEALRLTVSATDAPLDARHLSRSLQGIPVTVGDKVIAGTAYGDDEQPEDVELTVVSVEPGGAGLVGSSTVVSEEGEEPEDVVHHPEGRIGGEAPTTAEALLAGLDNELEIMTGWLSLLTSRQDLPDAWGLPRVAGCGCVARGSCRLREVRARGGGSRTGGRPGPGGLARVGVQARQAAGEARESGEVRTRAGGDLRRSSRRRRR